MLTEYGDGMLTCVECSEGLVGGGIPTVDYLRQLGFRVRCAQCGVMGPRRPTPITAKEAWNRIQRALEAFEDAERHERDEETKLKLFHTVLDLPLPIIGTPKQQEQCDQIAKDTKR